MHGGHADNAMGHHKLKPARRDASNFRTRFLSSGLDQKMAWILEPMNVCNSIHWLCRYALPGKAHTQVAAARPRQLYKTVVAGTNQVPLCTVPPGL